MLYISTSNGIFAYHPDSTKISHVITNKNRAGFFSKKSLGFFGICINQNNNVIVASREKLGTPGAGKPTTDAGLHSINPLTNTYETIGYVTDIHDVHQIDAWKNTVLLTDTGKNRIIGYNTQTGNISCTINFGRVRDDINHINAVKIDNNKIMVGLNNRGKKPSEIVYLPISIIDTQTEIDDAFEHAIEIKSLPPYTNTHDIELYNDRLLVCASHDSIVFDALSLKPVLSSQSWVRGIAHDDKYTWIGQSHYAKRSRRHSKSLAGSVLKVDTKTMEIIETIAIPGTGQINDLLYVKTD